MEEASQATIYGAERKDNYTRSGKGKMRNLGEEDNKGSICDIIVLIVTYHILLC